MMRFFAFLIFLVCAKTFAADPLPALGADPTHVTVSGVSSGGYMAVQLHVAHSAVVKGAGVIAGGPYYCAQGSLWIAYNNCMTPGGWAMLPATSFLALETQSLERQGRVDATSNLASARVWLFTGSNDRTVLPQAVRALRDFYAAYKANAVLVDGKPAGHGMITVNSGNACGATAPPFINDCDYDAAGELLRHLLGSLKPPPAKESGRVVVFDQKSFAGGDARELSMGDSGYVYVPKACEMESCRVHVALHGCRQNAAEIGERFVREAGYNRWADSNRLVVLYPQTVARNGWAAGSPGFVWNPRGCWDWWGYTGPRYHTKEGPQIRAVKAMLDRLSAPRGAR